MVRKRVLDPKPIFDEEYMLEFLAQHDVKPVHAGKIWRHVMDNPDCPFDEIPGIPKKIRIPLRHEFVLSTSTISKVQVSEIDGTVKFLIRLQDGHEIESVIISHTGEFDPFGTERSERAGTRNTLCVSSQVGCRLKCTFCATGTMGLLGDLTGGEIMEQLMHARNQREVQNVVFMGMGEPLENMTGVVGALRGFTDTQRFGLAPRNVTVSTVGIIPNMRKLVERVPSVKLALSLHAPNQELREKLVPSAKNFRLPDLMQFVDEYAAKYANDGRRKGMVMISYVMIEGVNSSLDLARELAILLAGKPVIVNIIPFNDFEGSPDNFKEPKAEITDAFIEVLKAEGMWVFERRHHGRDIAAACGQLAKLEKGGGTVGQVIEVEEVHGGCGGVVKEKPKVNALARDIVKNRQTQVKKSLKKRVLDKFDNMTPTQKITVLGVGTLCGLGAVVLLFRRRSNYCI